MRALAFMTLRGSGQAFHVHGPNISLLAGEDRRRTDGSPQLLSNNEKIGGTERLTAANTVCRKQIWRGSYNRIVGQRSLDGRDGGGGNDQPLTLYFLLGISFYERRR
jgi:hypothetical protein